MIRFDCLTLFPDMLRAVLGDSIIGRAASRGLLDIRYVNIRDFAGNKHNRVDDAPYGGGSGMVMQPGPIYDAYRSVADGLDYKPHVIYLSPQGRVFDQSVAAELVQKRHLVLLCGHYEGVDERVLEEIVDEELSLGDFVLTGGEIPAMAVIDAVSRLVPGVLSSEEAYQQESHFSGLLEYPHYTRPPEFHGRSVPDILLSGHHENVDKWRHEQALLRTRRKRPDMLARADLTEEDKRFLERTPETTDT